VKHVRSQKTYVNSGEPHEQDGAAVLEGEKEETKVLELDVDASR
jgi:hypothetical protein